MHDVSVVIPAYNAARYLPETIASVHAQTLTPIEIIVVDDGSNDNTAKVASGMGAKVISQKNAGQAAARNRGVEAAKGDWIGFLDADDFWYPEKLERQIALASETGADFVFAGRVERNEQTGREVSISASERLWPALLFRNPIGASTVVARRELLLRFPFDSDSDVLGCEDWDCWFRIYRSGAKFASIQSPLIRYRVSPTQFSANPNRMFRAFAVMFDKNTLRDFGTLRRWLSRQKAFSRQLCSAGLISRENGRKKEELDFYVRALLHNPIDPLPWKLLAVALSRLTTKNSNSDRTLSA
jgi:glycosyltransferase involved in cell wall biosynthesis